CRGARGVSICRTSVRFAPTLNCGSAARGARAWSRASRRTAAVSCCTRRCRNCGRGCATRARSGRCPLRRWTRSSPRASSGLRMRIDRVDALAGGGRAILDYKSGRRVSADWYGERPTHPQLLAYSEALGEEVVALATVSVNAREVRFDGIARAPHLQPAVRPVRAAGAADAWTEQRRAWRALLTGLI